MGYIRAEEILPKEVVALIQQYVDGQTIYIPRKAFRESLEAIKHLLPNRFAPVQAFRRMKN